MNLSARLDALVAEAGPERVARLRRAPMSVVDAEHTLARLVEQLELAAPDPFESMEHPTLPPAEPVEPAERKAPRVREVVPSLAPAIPEDLDPAGSEEVEVEDAQVELLEITPPPDPHQLADISLDDGSVGDSVDADLRRFFSDGPSTGERGLIGPPSAPPGPLNADGDEPATPSPGPRRDSSLLTSVKKLFRK
jgi:hypothetical protein